jgi:hypothetical protein
MSEVEESAYIRKMIADYVLKGDPLLQVVFRTADTLLHRIGRHAIATSFIREDGVHATGRAIDISSQGMPLIKGRQIEAAINREFPREDEYETCLYHDSGSGIHFHLQVAPTLRRASWTLTRRGE